MSGLLKNSKTTVGTFDMKTLFTVLLLLGISTFSKSQNKLEPIDDFGSNPRHLRMYAYRPQNFKSNMPLVVVLHGCMQNAKQCAKLTDWNKLADEYGFAVIYPQQPMRNNPMRCFNWFSENNQQRDKGEPLCINEMVEYAKKSWSIDSQRIYVTGLSAGGAMTICLLATYPDKFKSGSVFSGGAYASASNFFLSSLAMRGWIIRGAENLGNLVRQAYPGFKGNYPTVCVFHGKADVIVNRRNAKEIIKQWTNVHQTDATPDRTELRFKNNKKVQLYEFHDNEGNAVVRFFAIKKMGHALATDPGKCPCQGGKRTMFSRDINFFSTYYAADFFGLIKTPCEDKSAPSEKCKMR